MKKDASFGLIPIYQDQQQLEFLLVKHVIGHWAFPKGHAENQESSLETAQREFEEETGVLAYEVDESMTFQEEYYPQKDGQIFHKTVIYYLATISDKRVKIQPEEIADYGWFDYKTAINRITFPADKKLLREVRKYLMEKK